MQATHDLGRLPIARRPPYGQWLSGAALLMILGLLVHAFARGQIEWSIVQRFLFAPSILSGVVMTLVMAVCAKTLSIVVGVCLAVMLLSKNKVFFGFAYFYKWLFRGMPVLLQLLIWFNLGLVFPVLGIPGVLQFNTVDLLTPFVATLLGLSLNQAAYTAEVVRAGILSIDSGQIEASKAIGMTRMLALRRIVMPQAMRVIIPPLGNETIGMVKLTSVASVIQYGEVLRNAENIYFANARVIELLFVAAAWYMAIVTVLTIGQYFLERHFSKGYGAALDGRKTVDAPAERRFDA